MNKGYLQERGSMWPDKKKLRSYWRKKRRLISGTQQNEASRKAISQLFPRLKKQNLVLSYASFADEFQTQELNNLLAAEGKLVLPKVDGENLRIFYVENPQKQLRRHPWGFLEPIPERCRKVEEAAISLAIIPGIAFDAAGSRLGYGKGFYDRFLMKLSPSTPSFGLGFKEQYSPRLLPGYTTDYLLNGLFLF